MVLWQQRWAHAAEYQGLKAALEAALAGQLPPGVSKAPRSAAMQEQRSVPSQARSPSETEVLLAREKYVGGLIRPRPKQAHAGIYIVAGNAWEGDDSLD